MTYLNLILTNYVSNKRFNQQWKINKDKENFDVAKSNSKDNRSDGVCRERRDLLRLLPHRPDRENQGEGVSTLTDIQVS